GAVADRHMFRMPARRRAKADADTGRSRHGPHHAGEGHGAVHAPLVPVARAEIIGFDGIALRVALPCDQDRRVADIALFDLDAAFQLYRTEDRSEEHTSE